MFKKLGELSKEELNGKKVFLRVDFNVPAGNGEVGEIYRIRAHKETIDFLISAGAKIALASHIDGSFKEIAGDIGEILGHEPAFEEDILNPSLSSQLTLFENVRKYEGEEINDSGFAEDLAKNFDLYVNDAFSVSHREHASVSAITKFLSSYAGFLTEKEINNLEKVLNEPAEGKTIILGGAKVSTKLPVVKNFLDKAEHILVAGALANTIFKAKGLKVGKSVVEDIEEQIDPERNREGSPRTKQDAEHVRGFVRGSQRASISYGVDWVHPKIVLPKDIVVSESPEGVRQGGPYGAGKIGESLPEVLPVHDLEDNQMILDIGPETAKQFSDIVKKSKTVIFNGPLGLAEIDAFSLGTKIVLDSMLKSGAFTVVGGGDTLALVEKLGLIDKFGYVSTGGGAMLEFLAGNRLPGLEALGYYER